MEFDWDLIVSSFVQQYGIRLYHEYDTIPCEEFRQLLSGLNGETPLGYVVQIRSEKDTKKIKEMTQNEKEIRNKWFTFKNQNTKKSEIKVEDISKIFSKIFR